MNTIDINWIGAAAPLIPLQKPLEEEHPFIRFHYSRIPAHIHAADLIIADEPSYAAYSSRLQKQLSPPCIVIGSPPYVYTRTIDGGCCDVLPLPLCRHELVYRIMKHARRRALAVNGFIIRFTYGWINGPKGSAELSHIEYQLLRLFTAAPGRVLNRDLITQYTDVRISSSSRSIDVHISRLRKKILAVSSSSQVVNPIKSIRGKGYRIEKKLVDNLLKTSGKR
mgnify:CR=1 FL=1